MKRVWAAVAAVGLLTGCGGGDGGDKAAAGAKTTEVTVKFHLEDYDTAFGDCEGTGGYTDIGTGASVTIKSGDGDVLGATKLGKGEASSNGTQMAFCDWTVKVPDVSTEEKFYVAEIAGRGEITSSRDDLAADGWTFELSLGEL